MAGGSDKKRIFRKGIGGMLRSLLANRRAQADDLTDPGNTCEGALRRMILLSLEAVETYTIPGDDIDYRQFRADVRHFAERFTRERHPDDTLILAGQFCSSLKDYFDRTSRFLSLQNTEYQKMVSLFTDTISSLNSSGQRTVAHLREIEQGIEHATLIEDVRSLRVRLGECLGNIREEISRQEVITAGLSDQFVKKEDTPAGSVVDAQTMAHAITDPVTGFPTQKQAESALMRALEDDQDYFVVPIVARGAEKIYAQLGNEVGDSCLDKFAERLRVLSSNGDSVFRWRGVTFLAILRRSATISEVRREIYGVINAQHDQSIQIGGRTLWLPISATWDAIAVTSPLSYLLLKIDQFITS